MSTDERQVKLDDLQVKQDQLISLMTDIKDKYSEEIECGLLLSNLRNASDQILKLRLKYAEGNLGTTLTTESGESFKIKE